MAETLLTNLVNPQVMGDIIDHKLVDAMKFAPLCDIDRTLEGRAGSKIYLPQYSYIGDADVVAENSAITPKLLAATMTSVAIQKIAVGVTLTDEAVLSGYGDPWGEAADQIVLSIASKLDNEVLSVLNNNTIVSANRIQQRHMETISDQMTSPSLQNSLKSLIERLADTSKRCNCLNVAGDRQRR